MKHLKEKSLKETYINLTIGGWGKRSFFVDYGLWSNENFRLKRNHLQASIDQKFVEIKVKVV